MVRRLLAAGCALAVLVALAARAEQPAAEEGEFRARTVQEWAARYDAQAVAATVNGEAIRLGEVHRQMRSAFGERPILPAVWDDLQARTLNQMIDRRLILAYLAERPGAGASEADINLAVERIEAELARQKVTLEEHLKALGLSREDMLHGLRWQIGWQRYLDRFLTAENLKRYFEQHRREFDGTELRVAHILLRTEGDDPTQLAAQKKRAEEIHGQITSGAISFREAAEQFSEAPSARGGGDLGFLARYGEMPEPFRAAAFELEAGETSGPVVTQFGVHIIHCAEVKAGTRTWEEARPELEKATTAYLFSWVADQQRPRAEVKRTGAIPYLDPTTGELTAAPKSP